MRLYGDKALDQRGLAYLWQKIVDLVKKSVPTKISQLENDRGFMTKNEAIGYSKAEVDSLLSVKQNVITDLEDIRSIPSQFFSKADKVVNTSNGKLAGLNAAGNLVDSGIVGEDVADEELTLIEISNLIDF